MAMYGLTSPTSPEKYRRHTIWEYSQAAPIVFNGDLYYYSVDHNLTDTAHLIDTSRCPVYIIAGEYDWVTPPEAGRQLAGRIKGVKFTEMTGLGHFPMSENYEAFKPYLMPILEEIARA